MSKKARSAKGQVVDFDLMKIKQQMASSAPPVDVQSRKDFIDRRLRRRSKKTQAPAPKQQSEENTEANSDQQLQSSQELEQQQADIEQPSEEQPDQEQSSTKQNNKQKARPKKQNNNETEE